MKKYDEAIKILSVAFRIPIEQVAGVRREPGTLWDPQIHCEHDADGLNPLFVRRIKEIQEIIEKYSTRSDG